MKYRLDEIVALCSEHGLKTCRVDQGRVDVVFRDDCALCFCNLVEEDDTLVGFEGTPWHSHGITIFMTGDATYIECDELDIVIGLVSGVLLVVSQFVNGTLVDRWITHEDEKLEVKYMESGEELVVQRMT